MRPITIDELRGRFGYDPVTGAIYRIDDESKKPLGTGRNGYWVISMGTEGCKPAHHVAWALHYGYWPSEIDHKDHNKRNNSIDNLRQATRSQNNANIGKFRGSTTAKGVSWEVRRKRFRAHIRINGRTQHIGYFDVLDEAAHAYNKKAIELFGEFAAINPIGQDKEMT